MKNTLSHVLSSLGLALTLSGLAGIPVAQAAIVNYDFVVTIDTAGPLLNQSFSGAFSYDDEGTPTIGANGEDLFSLDSFGFTFNGVTYGLGDLSPGDAAVEAGQFTGLEAGALLFAFVPASGPFAASFAFDDGNGSAGSGAVDYQLDQNTVPEPATGGLVVAALLGAAALRRPSWALRS